MLLPFFGMPFLATAASLQDVPVVRGPSLVARGDLTRFRAKGFPLDTAVSVQLVPAVNWGGNCCGIVVVKRTAVTDVGTATLRFQWPRGFYRCSGSRCNLYAWTPGQRVVVSVSTINSRGVPVEAHTSARIR